MQSDSFKQNPIESLHWFINWTNCSSRQSFYYLYKKHTKKKKENTENSCLQLLVVYINKEIN